MGTLAKLERAAWRLGTGSSHDNYRQALWRPSKQHIDEVGGWATFEGDPAAGTNRRRWNQVGVLAIKDNQLEALFEQKDVQPAVAFAMGSHVVKGLLGSFEDIGQVQTLTSKDRAHGLRIGPERVQFSVGIIDGDGMFVSPEQKYFDVQGPLNAGNVGSPFGAYEHLRFS